MSPLADSTVNRDVGIMIYRKAAQLVLEYDASGE